MSVLAKETRNVQNPAIGASMLWRFACGYIETHRTAQSPPLQLIFLVLPILFHEQTATAVRNTRIGSGLRVFAEKFGQSNVVKQDLLLAIHDRALKLRKLTVEALHLGIATRLIFMDMDGIVTPLSTTQAVAGMSDEAKILMRCSEKLGVWCAPLTLHEVSSTLKIRF